MDLSARQRFADFKLPLAAAAAAGGGGLAGVLFNEQGAARALALVLLPVVALAVLRTLWAAVGLVLSVVCLAPYATLPVGTSVTPTLLEVALLVALGLTVAVILLDRRLVLRTGGPIAWWLALVGVLVAAFLLGVGRGYTTQTLHDFGKFLLAIAVFWMAMQLVSGAPDAARVRLMLVMGTLVAALVALALYAGGPSVTERVLARLIPYGYPSSRIVRFIEDDPAKPMRAVGTSVDPNSFGGLLMVGCVLSLSTLLSTTDRRLRAVALVALAANGAAMLLTYSRGAWVGGAVGVAVVLAVLRWRWLVALAIVTTAALAAGAGGGFVDRLWQGLTLRDPATKLRISEYRNAWAIVRRHPWFGVGFGDAPSIDLQTGVSSIYFTIAEQAGLIGLALFLVTVGVIGWRAAITWHRQRKAAEGPELVAFGAAVVAALTVGLVDHYFANPRFPHMVALLWLLAGVLAGLSAGHSAAPLKQPVRRAYPLGRGTGPQRS